MYEMNHSSVIDNYNGAVFDAISNFNPPSSTKTNSQYVGSEEDQITKICTDTSTLSYPFFHYHDYSRQPDFDNLTPITLPGHIPTFPVKLHMILCREDLSDIISWMPHGRAWKVHKPKKFEAIVLPTYFEHCKYSSFIRQANGWGFRRIYSNCRDKNCYYHERFLRGLPHLCKDWKRPRVAQKISIQLDHEPDLYKISELYPIPEDTEKVVPCPSLICKLDSVNVDMRSMANKETISSRTTKSCLVSDTTFLYPSLTSMTMKTTLTTSDDPETNILSPQDFDALSSFYSLMNEIDGGISEFSRQLSMKLQTVQSPTPNHNYINQTCISSLPMDRKSI